MNNFIPKSLVVNYIDKVVSDFIDKNEHIAEDVKEYDVVLEELRLHLRYNHEQVPFICSLKKIIEDSTLNIQEFYGYSYPIEDVELIDLIKYLYVTLKPKSEINYGDVEFIDESLESYRVKAGLLYHVHKGDSLSKISIVNSIELSDLVKLNQYWESNYGTDGELDEGEYVRLKTTAEWL